MCIRDRVSTQSTWEAYERKQQDTRLQKMSMTYEEAMDYIASVGRFGTNYGLKRTFRLLEILGSPEKKLKLIHVAGTNGKGSTTAMITKILRGMGYKVGMYTSPYLEEFEERIQINGINIPKETLVNLLEEVKNAVSKVIEENYDHPTEFEILTALMFLYFYKEGVDYGVIEVGLGGLLDSTNVLTPKVSVITAISMDHMNILGDTIEEIANQKAGIIKENIPTVLYPQSKVVEEIILKYAKKMNSKVHLVNINDAKLLEFNEEYYYQKVQIKGINNIYNVNLPLLGEHQILNLSVAIRAVEVLFNNENLEIDQEKLENSLVDVEWKGRLEILHKNPLVVIDGAHNIDGIKSLKKNVLKYFKYNNIYLLLGILADKQVEEMIQEIVPIAKKVIALTPHSERAELSYDLRKRIYKYNINTVAFESYEEAFCCVLKEAQADDLILISGSIYMIGDMRKIIRKYFNIRHRVNSNSQGRNKLFV
eukprot:TRINITY_DN11524_c0_g1_i4.p1 TRINITY_DN11524_c0_g1~~TRINITY_DN11524_c0_g1_i4.p1  ORF type:complete len:527 (+),score=95.16 TRINITY_DN11524_c0_g1_i4:143-1582(+)